MMKKLFLLTLCFLVSLAFFAKITLGADVCVDNATALQTALDNAEGSGENKEKGSSIL